MLNHELLINKGFKLNSYPEGNFYELVITDETTIEKIVKTGEANYDPELIDEKIILQMKDDFSNKLICIGCNVWDLRDNELMDILEVI